MKLNYKYGLNMRRDKLWLLSPDNHTKIYLHSSLSGNDWYAFEVEDGYIINVQTVSSVVFRLENLYKIWERRFSVEDIQNKIGTDIQSLTPTQYDLDTIKSRGRLLIDGDNIETEDTNSLDSL